MTEPSQEALAQEIVNATEQGIDQETLAAIASAPPSVEGYAPLEEHTVEVTEVMLRQITKALVLGTPMPRLVTPAQRAMRDKLAAEVKAIQDKGGGVELPFDFPGEDEEPI